MISFFNKGELISLGLPFCIFVDFTIYVIGIDQPLVVFMARYLIFKSNKKSEIIKFILYLSFHLDNKNEDDKAFSKE